MPYAWRVLLGACLGQMASLGFGRFTYAALLPGMRDGLGLSYAESGLLATANLLGFLLGSLVVSSLTARLGLRRTVAGALLLVSLALILTGAAPGLPVALVAQFLTGIGTVGAAVPTIGLITTWFTSARRGLAAGICVSGVGVGFLIGSATAPVIAATAGHLLAGAAWRYAWYTLALFVAAAGAGCVALIRSQPAAIGVEPWGPSDVDGAGRRWVGLAPRAADDARPVWRDSVLWYLGALYVSFGLTYTGYATFFPALLVASGWDQVAAAQLWALVGVAGIPGAIGWGRLSDRIGRPAALLGAFLLMGTAAALLVISVDRLAIVSAVLFGVSLSTIPTTMSVAAGDRVGPGRVYAAVAFLHAWSGVGQVIGPVLAGATIDLSQAFVTTYLLSATYGAIAAGLAGGLALWQERGRPRAVAPATGSTGT